LETVFGSMPNSSKLSKKGLTNSWEHGIVVQYAKVAQLVEHSTENAGVVGSIPSLGTFHLDRTVWNGFTGRFIRFFC
jgi:hypothetical protein